MVDKVMEWSACADVEKGEFGKGFTHVFRTFQSAMDRKDIYPVRIKKLDIYDPEAKRRVHISLKVEFAPGKTDQSFKDWFFTQ